MTRQEFDRQFAVRPELASLPYSEDELEAINDAVFQEVRSLKPFYDATAATVAQAFKRRLDG